MRCRDRHGECHRYETMNPAKEYAVNSTLNSGQRRFGAPVSISRRSRVRESSDSGKLDAVRADPPATTAPENFSTSHGSAAAVRQRSRCVPVSTPSTHPPRALHPPHIETATRWAGSRRCNPRWCSCHPARCPPPPETPRHSMGTRLPSRRCSSSGASDLQPRCVVPEIFQAIHFALRRMENVDDHITVIRDDPLAERIAVQSQRADLVLLLEPVFDFAGDGLELRLGRAGADDEEIGE